ncbi:MAG TPA: 2Fe-2S iron-sulfur cluster-binding protein [Candidatus Limnocylindrales bacterium]|nr:2Fe-2S iron-sulfur cluster-binding protein [Candidatus Limnocylindrales bacterium]
MSNKLISILRYSPVQKTYTRSDYRLPPMPDATVLQALQYIYEELDPTLAFRYGCRYNHCGLCGVTVDGKPGLSCKAKLEGVKEIAPLANLPLLRDLVVDRSAYFRTLQESSLYPQKNNMEPLGCLKEDELHKNLMNCLECLCCVASCRPEGNIGENRINDPYLFVKLAQLHLDPRDNADRRAQARELGSERCYDCRKCFCPNGIRLKEAISVLLD